MRRIVLEPKVFNSMAKTYEHIKHVLTSQTPSNGSPLPIYCHEVSLKKRKEKEVCIVVIAIAYRKSFLFQTSDMSISFTARFG